ncbi:hypothetical protein AVEN_113721-1 [Araneus ventricosus]|uniref:Uncharacterized protein n=1 Tax=Araneus ventricosus TaxID=182803 RepID=A0A4Y2HWQ0_ARAVE|nr:hypothetical protein AVEN_113721-1 [Araneus ventricosus]
MLKLIEPKKSLDSSVFRKRDCYLDLLVGFTLGSLGILLIWMQEEVTSLFSGKRAQIKVSSDSGDEINFSCYRIISNALQSVPEMGKVRKDIILIIPESSTSLLMYILKIHFTVHAPNKNDMGVSLFETCTLSEDLEIY